MKKEDKKAMKQNALCLASVVAGSLIGYTVGGMSALPSGVVAIISKNKYLTAGAAGAMSGGFLAGATEPASDTGEFGKDFVENAKSRGKSTVRGLAKGFYVDRIAPKVMDSLSGHHVTDIDYGAAEQFIRQIEAKEAGLNQYTPVPDAVNGIDTYRPTSMAGLEQYMP
jgi:hypothetical protein